MPGVCGFILDGKAAKLLLSRELLQNVKCKVECKGDFAIEGILGGLRGDA